MHAVTHLLCIALLFPIYINFGHTLKCYNCKSYVNKTCATLEKSDPQAVTFLQTCSLNASACRKVEQRLTYNGEEHIRFYRQCAIASGPKRCVEKSGTIGVKIIYCDCDEDECNSALGTFSSLTHFTISIPIFGALRNFIIHLKHAFI